MKCCRCDKDCTDDWFMINISRIKGNHLYLPDTNPTILCLDCYGVVVNAVNHGEGFEKE